METSGAKCAALAETTVFLGFFEDMPDRRQPGTRAELGARFDTMTVWGDVPVTFRGQAAWAYDWASAAALTASFESLPGTSFVVNGAPVPKNSALVSAGVKLHLTPNWMMSGRFDGAFGGHSHGYAGTATLQVRW